MPWARPAPAASCRKVESFDAKKAGTVELESAEERDKRAADPFAQLEHGGEDKRRALATFTQIAALQEESGAKHRWAGGDMCGADQWLVARTCCFGASWLCLRCGTRGGAVRERAE